MKTETHAYKKALEAELKTITDELKSVGHINPSNPNDWEANAPHDIEDDADENLTADNIEAYESNSALLKQEEIRFNEIKAALKRIENGTYGNCDTCGKPIEAKRLNANPAATTCISCMKAD